MKITRKEYEGSSFEDQEFVDGAQSYYVNSTISFWVFVCKVRNITLGANNTRYFYLFEKNNNLLLLALPCGFNGLTTIKAAELIEKLITVSISAEPKEYKPSPEHAVFERALDLENPKEKALAVHAAYIICDLHRAQEIRKKYNITE